jgi:hypothetical protein
MYTVANREDLSDGRHANRRLLVGILVVISLLIAISLAVICYLAMEPEAPVSITTKPIDQATTSDAAISGIHGRVRASDGSPVSGATVPLVPRGPNGLRIRNGKVFFEERGGLPVPRVSTDGQGNYVLPQGKGIFAVLAVANNGFAKLNQDEAAKNTDLTLTKWGRIEGQLITGSKPAAHVRLGASVMAPIEERDQVIVSMVSFAQTDAHGKFAMEGVVPGANFIERDYEQASGADTMTYSVTIGTVDVAADKTATVTLGGGGRTVIGKFVFDKSLNPADYFVNARAYPMDPHGNIAVYFLQVDRDRKFIIDDVPPGDYRIHINLDATTGDRKSEADRPQFTVPDDKGTDPVMIPDIELK